jgi:hypothetical protein
MSETNRLEIRFPGEELAPYTSEGGVTYRLFYRSDDEHYVVHNDDPRGPAWLEDGRANGLTAAHVRWYRPELAEAAGLEE